MPTCPDHLTGALLSAGLTLGAVAFLIVGSALGEPISTGRSGVPNKGEGVATLPWPKPNEYVHCVGVSWVLVEGFSALAKRLCPLVACFPAKGLCFEIVVLAASDENAESTGACAATSKSPEKGFGSRSPSRFGAACASPVAFPDSSVAFSSGDFATPLPSDCHFNQVRDVLIASLRLTEPELTKCSTTVPGAIISSRTYR